MKCDSCQQDIPLDKIKILSYGEGLDSTQIFLCGYCYDELKGQPVQVNGKEYTLH